MAVNGNFFKLYNLIGNYRSFLSTRISLPMYQPVATLKQSLEESIGLPPLPKRPLTPFFQFNKDMRPMIVKKHPELKMVEVTKVLAREWRNTGQDLKDKLRNDYDAKLEEYIKTKEKYYESMSDEQKARLIAAKSEGKIQKEKRLHKKALKGLGKPKRPMAAIFQWIRSVGGKRGKTPLVEWQKDMVNKWQALPAEEKRPFETQMAKEYEEYKIEMMKWEEKMLTKSNNKSVKKTKSVKKPSKAAKENEISTE